MKNHRSFIAVLLTIFIVNVFSSTIISPHYSSKPQIDLNDENSQKNNEYLLYPSFTNTDTQGSRTETFARYPSSVSAAATIDYTVLGCSAGTSNLAAVQIDDGCVLKCHGAGITYFGFPSTTWTGFVSGINARPPMANAIHFNLAESGLGVKSFGYDSTTIGTLSGGVGIDDTYYGSNIGTAWVSSPKSTGDVIVDYIREYYIYTDWAPDISVSVNGDYSSSTATIAYDRDLAITVDINDILGPTISSNVGTYPAYSQFRVAISISVGGVVVISENSYSLAYQSTFSRSYSIPKEQLVGGQAVSITVEARDTDSRMSPNNEKISTWQGTWAVSNLVPTTQIIGTQNCIETTSPNWLKNSIIATWTNTYHFDTNAPASLTYQITDDGSNVGGWVDVYSIPSSSMSGTLIGALPYISQAAYQTTIKNELYALTRMDRYSWAINRQQLTPTTTTINIDLLKAVQWSGENYLFFQIDDGWGSNRVEFYGYYVEDRESSQLSFVYSTDQTNYGSTYSLNIKYTEVNDYSINHISNPLNSLWGTDGLHSNGGAYITLKLYDPEYDTWDSLFTWDDNYIVGGITGIHSNQIYSYDIGMLTSPSPTDFRDSGGFYQYRFAVHVWDGFWNPAILNPFLSQQEQVKEFYLTITNDVPTITAAVVDGTTTVYFDENDVLTMPIHTTQSLQIIVADSTFAASTNYLQLWDGPTIVFNQHWSDGIASSISLPTSITENVGDHFMVAKVWDGLSVWEPQIQFGFVISIQDTSLPSITVSINGIYLSNEDNIEIEYGPSGVSNVAFKIEDLTISNPQLYVTLDGISLIPLRSWASGQYFTFSTEQIQWGLLNSEKPAIISYNDGNLPIFASFVIHFHLVNMEVPQIAASLDRPVSHGETYLLPYGTLRTINIVGTDPSIKYTGGQYSLLITKGATTYYTFGSGWQFDQDMIITTDTAPMMNSIGTYTVRITANDNLVGGYREFIFYIEVQNILPTVNLQFNTGQSILHQDEYYLEYGSSTINSLQLMITDTSVSTTFYSIVREYVTVGSGSWISGNLLQFSLNDVLFASPASYEYSLEVVDGYGGNILIQFTLHVVNEETPQINFFNFPADLYYGTGFRFTPSIAIIDPSVSNGWIDVLLDGVNITKISNWVSGSSIPFTLFDGTLDGLSGSHILNFIAYDGLGQSNSREFTFNIIAANPSAMNVMLPEFTNETSIIATWDSIQGVEAYHIYRNGIYEGNTMNTVYLFTFPASNAVYNLTFIASNFYGNSTPTEKFITIIRSAPSVSTWNSTNAEIADDTSEDLRWNQNPFAETYYIFIDNVLMTTLGRMDTFFHYFVSFIAQTRTYHIIASNRYGNATMSSPLVLSHVFTPSTVSLNTSAVELFNQFSYTLSFNNSYNAEQYLIYQNGALIKTAVANLNQVQMLVHVPLIFPAISAEYSITIKASNQYNQSEFSEAKMIKVMAYAPQSFLLSCNSTRSFGDSVLLTWTPSENATRYLIYRNATYLDQTASLNYTINPPPASVYYTYYVIASNLAGIYTSNAIIIEFDLSRPIIPSISSLNRTNSINYLFTWNGSLNTDYYIVSLNGLQLGNTSNTEYMIMLPSENRINNLSVKAINRFGESGLSTMALFSQVAIPTKIAYLMGIYTYYNQESINLQFTTDIYTDSIDVFVDNILIETLNGTLPYNYLLQLNGPSFNKSIVVNLRANNLIGSVNSEKIFTLLYFSPQSFELDPSQSYSVDKLIHLEWMISNYAESYHIYVNGESYLNTTATHADLTLPYGAYNIQIWAINDFGVYMTPSYTYLLVEEETPVPPPPSKTVTYIIAGFLIGGAIAVGGYAAISTLKGRKTPT